MEKVNGFAALFDMLGGILLAFLSCALIIGGHVTAGVSSMVFAVIYIGSRIFKGEKE